MNRRRLLIANSHGGGIGDVEPDYTFDFGDKTGITMTISGNIAIDAYNRLNNGESIRVRVITIYGTFDFYDFEEERRSYCSSNVDIITGQGKPVSLDIFSDGSLELYIP